MDSEKEGIEKAIRDGFKFMDLEKRSIEEAIKFAIKFLGEESTLSNRVSEIEVSLRGVEKNLNAIKESIIGGFHYLADDSSPTVDLENIASSLGDIADALAFIINRSIPGGEEFLLKSEREADNP